MKFCKAASEGWLLHERNRFKSCRLTLFISNISILPILPILPVIAGDDVDQHAQQIKQCMQHHATSFFDSNTAWCLGQTLCLVLPTVEKHRGTTAEATMKEAIPKELSSTLWAFAKLACTDVVFFHAVADIAECLDSLHILHHFTSFCIQLRFFMFFLSSFCPWFVVFLVAVPSGSFRFLVLRSKIGQCDSQSLSNLVWTFATVLIQPGPLIPLIAQASFRSLNTFAPQELLGVSSTEFDIFVYLFVYLCIFTYIYA